MGDGLICFHLGKSEKVWSGSVVVKRWTISPEVRASILGLTRTFLTHFVFPT